MANKLKSFYDKYRQKCWILILFAFSILCFFGQACVTPFVALAAMANCTMERKNTLFVMSYIWIGNQLVGYGYFNYPHDIETALWGLVIGLGAIAATLMINFMAANITQSRWLKMTISMIIGFVCYQGVIYSATYFLSSMPAAFSAKTLMLIALSNVLSLLVLLAIEKAIKLIIGSNYPARKVTSY